MRIFARAPDDILLKQRAWMVAVVLCCVVAVLRLCGSGAAVAVVSLLLWLSLWRAGRVYDSPGHVVNSPSPLKFMKQAGAVGVSGQTPVRAESRKALLASMATAGADTAQSGPPPLPPSQQQQRGGGDSFQQQQQAQQQQQQQQQQQLQQLQQQQQQLQAVQSAMAMHMPPMAFTQSEPQELPPGMVEVFKDGYLYVVPEVSAHWWFLACERSPPLRLLRPCEWIRLVWWCVCWTLTRTRSWRCRCLVGWTSRAI